jgi:hypothetical protein
MMTPEQLALIWQELEPELPELVGEPAWSDMSPVWREKLQQLQTSSYEIEQMRLAAELRTMLAAYTPARERLQAATGGVSKYQQVLTRLAYLAPRLNGDPDEIEQLAEAAALHSHVTESRVIILKAVGQTAKSIKWQNIEFDFGELSDKAGIAAGILASLSNIINPEKGYLLMAAGALMIIGGVIKGVTKEISAEDASVFWGVIQAQRHNVPRRVDTGQVMEYANRERARVHLPALTEQQGRRALHNLVELGSVERVKDEPEIWRVIEKYREPRAAQ